MEVKGKHLLNDGNSWKEGFLECMQGACAAGKRPSETLRAPFLPFFIVNEDKRFKDEFAKFLQSKFGD